MSEPFAWVGDVSRGGWIAERLDFRPWPERLGEALAWLVPSGFDALVRVLHPFGRDRLVDGDYTEFIERLHAGAVHEAPETLREEGVPWRVVAEVHRAESGGVELRPDSLSHELLGLGYGEHRDVESSDGWRYHSPQEGNPGLETLAALAAVLAEHTGTPERGIAAIWEGYGGLVSSMGTARFGWDEQGAPYSWSGTDPTPGSGVLPAEAAAGARLELPDRSYVCFEAGIRDFAEEGGSAWPERAPWVEDAAMPWIHTPNLIWPEGREWVLVSEIDFDSTLIACSRDCASALLAAPSLEAFEITRNTPLWRFAA